LSSEKASDKFAYESLRSARLSNLGLHGADGRRLPKQVPKLGIQFENLHCSAFGSAAAARNSLTVAADIWAINPLSK